VNFIGEFGGPLFEAADFATVQMLVEKYGLPANQLDTNGTSVFYNAVFKGNRKIVNYLLDKGADPMVLGPQNSSVMHICAERQFNDLAKDIIERDRAEYAQLLFIQVKPRDEDDESAGNTPMHTACEWNSIDLVDYFFEVGGKKLVYTRNAEGMDVLEFC
jgi:ankyrin repeat protein